LLLAFPKKHRFLHRIIWVVTDNVPYEDLQPMVTCTDASEIEAN